MDAEPSSFSFDQLPFGNSLLDALTDDFLSNPLPAIGGAAGFFHFPHLPDFGGILDALDELGGWVWDRFREGYDLSSRLINDVADWGGIVIGYVIEKGGDVIGAAWDVGRFVVDEAGNLASWTVGAAWDVGRFVVTEAGNLASWTVGAAWDVGRFVVTEASNLANWTVGAAWDVGHYVVGEAGNLGSWIVGVISQGIDTASQLANDNIQWLWQQIGPIRTEIKESFTNTKEFFTQEIVGGVIAGATSIGEFFMDGLKWLVESAFGSFEDLFRKRITTLHRFMDADFSSIEELTGELDYGIRGGSIVSMMESVIGGIFMVPSLIGGIGTAYAEPHVQLALKKVHATLPPVLDLRDALLRGVIDDGEHDESLRLMGFADDRIAWLKELYALQPTPSDLIRFLVREVFSPDVRQRFGQDADYPDAADAEGRKIGLFGDTLRDYWAAHWDLPSTEQGFEMLHRGHLEMDDLQLLLRAKDVMPFWRDRLINIAYNVPGRIDLRRMYRAGVFDETRLLRGYADLGYATDDAAALVEFAKRDAAGSQKDLPRETLLRAYRNGLLERGLVHDELAGLGFTEDDVELMLALEDLRNAEEDATLAEDIVEADFKAGAIDESTTRTELIDLGVPSARVELLIKRWRRRAAVRTSTLSAALVQRALREKLIDETAARGRLGALGFNSDDVGIMVELARPDVAAVEPPELSVSQLFRALRENLIDDADLRGRLQRRGYVDTDVDILVELAVPDQVAAEPVELTKAELVKAAKTKVITPEQLQQRLLAKGYTPADIDVLLAAEKIGAPPTPEPEKVRRRELTVAQHQKAFKEELITEAELRARLAALGFSAPDVDILVELVK